MWAQQWNNIYDLVEPFKGVQEIDVTPEMLRQVSDVTLECTSCKGRQTRMLRQVGNITPEMISK